MLRKLVPIATGTSFYNFPTFTNVSLNHFLIYTPTFAIRLVLGNGIKIQLI